MKIHIVGLGGIGVSALAQIYLAQGHTVQGSDVTDSAHLQYLRQLGISVFIGQSASNVSADVSRVVISLAIPKTNPEVQQAKALKIPIVTYPEALGELTRQKYTVAVLGTHGKSTTTALAARVLLAGGFDPTVVVGTKMREFGETNVRVAPRSDYLLIEACEYAEAFLNYQVEVAVITNIEPDHLDYYGTPERYYAAFAKFLRQLNQTGKIVADFSQPKIAELTRHCPQEKIAAETFSPSLKLQVPGVHNQQNARLAYALGRALAVPEPAIREAIEGFTGTWRRAERVGQTSTGAIVFSDYAHHPTAVKMTLQGFRDFFPDKKILCVFQPHQYSRTKDFWEEFVTAFDAADRVIIPDIYLSRETETMPADYPARLAAAIAAQGVPATGGQGLAHTAQQLQTVTSDYLILLMGAGSVYTLADQIVAK